MSCNNFLNYFMCLFFILSNILYVWLIKSSINQYSRSDCNAHRCCCCWCVVSCTTGWVMIFTVVNSLNYFFPSFFISLLFFFHFFLGYSLFYRSILRSFLSTKDHWLGAASRCKIIRVSAIPEAKENG